MKINTNYATYFGEHKKSKNKLQSVHSSSPPPLPQGARGENNKNPITTRGERETLLKATAIAGLGVGGEALWYLMEDGFIFEDLFDYGSKIVDKQKPQIKGAKKGMLYLGAWGALTLGFVAAIAALYTLYQTPKIMYEGKVNAFKKGKDMDLYIKGNKVEKELYDQMNEKAENAKTKEEKQRLYQQYLKLVAAKNQVPEFVQKQV